MRYVILGKKIGPGCQAIKKLDDFGRGRGLSIIICPHTQVSERRYTWAVHFCQGARSNKTFVLRRFEFEHEAMTKCFYVCIHGAMISLLAQLQPYSYTTIKFMNDVTQLHIKQKQSANVRRNKKRNSVIFRISIIELCSEAIHLKTPKYKVT